MPSDSTSTTSGKVVSPDSDDATLVDAALGGNKAAFRVIYDRYQRRLYAVAFGYVRNRDEALEILQETFIKVHRNLHRFEGNSSLYTWLYRILNAAKDHLRRNKRRTSYEFEDDRADGRDETHPVGVGVSGLGRFGTSSHITEHREIMVAIRSALDELSDNHRAVLTMREFKGNDLRGDGSGDVVLHGDHHEPPVSRAEEHAKKLRQRLAGYVKILSPRLRNEMKNAPHGASRKLRRHHEHPRRRA